MPLLEFRPVLSPLKFYFPECILYFLSSEFRCLSFSTQSSYILLGFSSFKKCSPPSSDPSIFTECSKVFILHVLCMLHIPTCLSSHYGQFINPLFPLVANSSYIPVFSSAFVHDITLLASLFTLINSSLFLSSSVHFHPTTMSII